LILFSLNSQTIIYNDNCEAAGYNWDGYPTVNLNSGYIAGSTNGNDRPLPANFYTSSTTGFASYGYGNGTSAYETELYQLPNVTGLNPTKTYRFKMRIMAYAQNYGSQIGSGLDVLDYVEIRISTNNSTYTTESRITGFDNCYWSFNATGVVNETANGALNTYGPTVGGNRETTGDGFSTYNLTLTGISQLAVRVFIRANYGGVAQGEWWVIDDMELWDMTPIPLPVELYSFYGEEKDGVNVIKWSTASEHNSDYFLLQKSISGDFDDSYIHKENALGESNNLFHYYFEDFNMKYGVSYYRLLQYDKNGEYKIYGPISINNSNKTKLIVKIVNIMGQEVDKNYRGLVILIYNDGTKEKVYI
jgi:hypothetical protein